MYCIKKTVTQSQLTLGQEQGYGVRYTHEPAFRPPAANVKTVLMPSPSPSPDAQHSSRCSNSYVKCNRRVLRISAGCRCPRGVRGNRRREEGGRRGGEQAVIVFDPRRVSAALQRPSDTDEAEERGRRALRGRPTGTCEIIFETRPDPNRQCGDPGREFDELKRVSWVSAKRLIW